MRNGEQAEYDFLFARYQAANNVASEQAMLLAALACATQSSLINEYAAIALSPSDYN